MRVRRNYDERRKFGTVSDELFRKGEIGLIGAEDDVDGNEKRNIPEWEQALENMGGKMD